MGRFVTEYGADHDRRRTSQARWRILRSAQREIGVPLSEVTAAQLKGWWFGAGTRRRDGAKRSPATRQSMRSHLQVFFRWCVLNALRSDDPIPFLPSVTVPLRKPRPADRVEVDRVLATTTGKARRAIVLAAELGLRCDEIAQLDRSSLQRTPDGGWRIWVRRKGNKLLSVEVPPGLARELLTIPAGVPWVPRPDGEHMTYSGVSRLIARTFAGAGSPIRAHALRHLSASELLDETSGDLRSVADQLGHRSMDTTAGYAAPTRSVRDALQRRDARNTPHSRRKQQ